MCDVILRNQEKAPVSSCASQPKHGAVQDVPDGPAHRHPENVSKLMKSAVTGAQDDPALMQHWSRPISIEIFMSLRLELATTRNGAARRDQDQEFALYHQPPALRHDVHLHTAHVAPEVEALALNEQICPGQISMALEARREGPHQGHRHVSLKLQLPDNPPSLGRHA